MNPSNVLLALALLLPLSAQARDPHPCKASAPRNLQLDFSGIDAVVFEVGGNEADIRASAKPSGRVEGLACASSDDRLARMTLTQQRSGSTLTIRALRSGDSDNNGNYNLSIFGRTMTAYAYLRFTASVPDDVMVKMLVGSGEARLEGAADAEVDVGSGDLDVNGVRGLLVAKVGSGDLQARTIGSVDLHSIGSGDAMVGQVRGASAIGSVGSGDLKISGTQGPVEIGSVGSGDVRLMNIGGNVLVGSIGSGDIDIDGVRGDLTVRSTGSGDVNHRGVTGRVDLPKKR